jgi:UDP-glucose 4-epimerase
MGRIVSNLHSPKAILVTGGAGYIGANLVHRLKKSGQNVIVVDNLSSGSIENIPPDILFFQGDIRDSKFLRYVFANNSISLVFHFAAKKSVEESTQNPQIFMETNVEGTSILLDVMHEFNCTKLIFSSTAAVYGDHEVRLEGFLETDQLSPSNPYGTSKLLAEQLIEESTKHSDLKAILFRFFNVGMSEIKLMEHSSHDLLSALSDCYKGSGIFEIFGRDYSTPDGTCYRDYVHMSDLLNALEKSRLLMNEKIEKLTVLNLGSGCAISLNEVARIGSGFFGPNFDFKYVDRRPGDVSYSLANISSARQILGWEPQISPKMLFDSFFQNLKKNND